MRRVYGFHGGIHPAENKHQSLGSRIRVAGIPRQLILPLSQHIGAPARPVVAVGDRVRRGQGIGALGADETLALQLALDGRALDPRRYLLPS